jgi:hypothetical protein
MVHLPAFWRANPSELINVLDDGCDRPVPSVHFLMMAAALVRRSGFEMETQHLIDLRFSAIFKTTLHQVALGEQKLSILQVLAQTPARFAIPSTLSLSFPPLEINTRLFKAKLATAFSFLMKKTINELSI